MASLTTLKIEKLLPASFTAPGLSDAEFLDVCAQVPDAMVEYTKEGTVTLMPPTDPESGARVFEVGGQLRNWAREQGKGIGSGPDTGFRFRDGSRLAPNAAWYDARRWARAKKSGERFPVFAPEFVIEFRSPDDRIRALREKMEDYIANGVQLGWLIDPMDRTVTIYRSAQQPRVLKNRATVDGGGAVAGFVLHLAGIFPR